MNLSVRAPLWRPGRSLPRFNDPELLALACQPHADLRPWAAFSLGHLPRTIGVVQTALAAVPELIERQLTEIPLAVSELKVACDVLAAVIPPNVAVRLERAADIVDKSHDSMVKSYARSKRSVAPSAAGVEAAERLPILADGAVETSHPLRPWYDVGRTLADARPAGMGAVVLSRIDHLVILMSCVRRLPTEHRRLWRSAQQDDKQPRWPLLGAVADLAEVERQDEPSLRRQFLATHGGYRDDRVGRAEIYWQLGQVTSEMNSYLKEAAKPRLKPFWEKESAKLFWDGEEIMCLDKTKATAIIPILDCFQSSNWPEEGIDDPDDYYARTKKGHIDTLNECLKVRRIRFCGNGTRRGIAWRPC